LKEKKDDAFLKANLETKETVLSFGIEHQKMASYFFHCVTNTGNKQIKLTWLKVLLFQVKNDSY
jgi:hypothetical protein